VSLVFLSSFTLIPYPCDGENTLANHTKSKYRFQDNPVAAYSLQSHFAGLSFYHSDGCRKQFFVFLWTGPPVFHNGDTPVADRKHLFEKSENRCQLCIFAGLLECGESGHIADLSGEYF